MSTKHSSTLSTSKNSPATASQATPAVNHYVDHFLSTVCDRSRRQILELLALPVDQTPLENAEPLAVIERRSTDIAKALKLSPGTTSSHLRQLTEARLVSSRRDGNAIYYRLSNHYLVSAFHDLMLALDHHYRHHIQQLSRDSDSQTE